MDKSMSEIVKIGNATLYHGDCREILPSLPKVDLVLTDPPYGIGASNAQFMRTGKQTGRSKCVSGLYESSTWDSDPIDDELLQLTINAGTNAIVFGGNYFNVSPSSCWLVWDKNNGGNKYADAELAWTNLKMAVRLKKYTWHGMIQENMSNKEIREHPTQKPVPIIEWCLNFAPKTTLTVADPFMGSGTTGVACANMGKTFYGIERERKYFDIACERIERAYAQQRLFE